MTWLLLALALLPTTASTGPLASGGDLAVQQANQTDDGSNRTTDFFQKIAAAVETPWITGSLLVLACAAAVLAQRLTRRRR